MKISGNRVATAALVVAVVAIVSMIVLSLWMMDKTHGFQEESGAINEISTKVNEINTALAISPTTSLNYYPRLIKGSKEVLTRSMIIAEQYHWNRLHKRLKSTHISVGLWERGIEKQGLSAHTDRVRSHIILQLSRILEETRSLLLETEATHDKFVRTNLVLLISVGTGLIFLLVLIALLYYLGFLRPINQAFEQIGEKTPSIESIESPFLMGELGSFLVKIFDHIAERMKAEQSLRTSEERLAMSQTAAHIGSWDWNIVSGGLEWSEQIEPLFGFRPGEFRRTYEAFLACVHPEDRKYLERSVQNALDDPEAVYDIEHRIVWTTGEVRWVSERGQVYRDDKRQPVRMLGVVQDITDRKVSESELAAYREHLEELVEERTKELEMAKEEAEGANKAKSVFLANMSHELRTPLNAVLGFSQIMRSSPDRSGEDIRNLDIIDHSGRHLLQLINDVLDMSKIEAGRVSLTTDDFDLGLLVLEITDMMGVKAAEKGLQLILDQSSDFPRFIHGDAAKLRQILINLLSNGIKFTEKGSVTLRLSTQPAEGGQQTTLCGEVEDTGPGIEPENLERIFAPFEQYADSASQKGTGLGLAITSKFVDMMGGKITAQSELGKGALFRFTLQVAPAEGEIVPKAAADFRQITGLAPGQPEYRILMAEDQPDNQVLLRHLLERIGFRVRLAENGEEAVRMFQEWRPHFIWMDRRMPVMDGLEATRRIRSLPDGKDVIIAAITASVFKDQQDELLNAGCNEFLPKPYRPRDIYDCMARWLGVAYTYDRETTQPVRREPSEEMTISKESLAALPEELREALRNAAISLDVSESLVLLERIELIEPDLSNALRQIVDKFDFHALKKLLDSDNVNTE